MLLLFFTVFFLNLSDIEAQPVEYPVEDRKYDANNSNLVEFIEWPEFVTQYLLDGNVRKLVYDPDGVVKIVLRKPSEYQMKEDYNLLMRTATDSRNYFEQNLRSVYAEFNFSSTMYPEIIDTKISHHEPEKFLLDWLVEVIRTVLGVLLELKLFIMTPLLIWWLMFATRVP